MAIDALRVLYIDALNDGEIISFVLPGTISTFSKLLMKPGLTVKPAVICSVLDVFASILRIVYCDSELKVVRTSFSDVKEIVENQTDTSGSLIRIDEADFKNKKMHRDIKWLRATTAQVKRALEGIVPKLLKRSNNSIKLALNDFLVTVMKSCTNSLINCQSFFLSTVLELRSATSDLLSTSNNLEVLKGMLSDMSGKIYKSIQFEEDANLRTFEYGLQALNSCHGVDPELVTRTTIQLQESLSEFLEQKNLRFNESTLIEQSGLVIVGQDFMKATEPVQRLLPRISAPQEEALSDLFSTLGSCYDKESLEQIVGILLSLDKTENAYSKSVSVWMCANLVKGYSEALRTCPDVTDEYLVCDSSDLHEIEDEQSEVCYIVIESCVEIISEVTQSATNLNQVAEFQTAVGLHSLKTISELMGSTFQTELIDVLFPVIDCLASASPFIRYFAQSTTLSFANSFFQGSVHDLIMGNIDYLVDAISIRLSNCMTQRISTLLMVICRVGGYSVMEGFKDVFETMFRLLDFYHGYEDLCLEFFQLFDIIVMEMKKQYLEATFDDHKLTNDHIVSGGFAPWGMHNMQQVLHILKKPILDGALNELDATTPNDQESNRFEEIFEQTVGEPDSDDEDDLDDQSTPQQGDNIKKENEKWSSPIPRDSYRLLLQIAGYSDRLLTHPSRQLKVQILLTMRKIFPMLATEHAMLLPQVAKSWDLIVQLTLSDDFALAKVACDCLRELIACSGDFVTKRFLDLWTLYRSSSQLLKIVAPRGVTVTDSSKKWLSSPRQFPLSTKEALVALCEMLLEGITNTGQLTSETQLQEMVYCCLLVLPRNIVESKSLILGDIVTFFSLQ